MNLPIYVLYHANCHDGWAAMEVVRKFLMDIIPIPIQYGSPPPPMEYGEVYIVDFSYDYETLTQLASQHKRVIVLDHHRSAVRKLGEAVANGSKPDNLFITLDENHSGAVLTWKHFSVLPPPLILTFVEDRDLWRFAYNNTRACHAYLSTLNMGVDPFPWEFTHTMTAEGAAILRYWRKCIEFHIEKASQLLIGEKTFWGVNCTMSEIISDVAGELSVRTGYGCTWYDTPDGRLYSLRSRDDSYDVSEIAEKFGGGGHVQAAGFRLPKRDKLTLLVGDLPPNMFEYAHKQGGYTCDVRMLPHVHVMHVYGTDDPELEPVIAEAKRRNIEVGYILA